MEVGVRRVEGSETMVDMHAHVLADQREIVAADEVSARIVEAVNRKHGYRRIVLSNNPGFWRTWSTELFWVTENFSGPGHDGNANIMGFDTRADGAH